MQCLTCATPVPDNAKFCYNCGSLVSDAEGQAEATASMTPDAFSHMESLLRGETQGEFQIESMLGRGGMAVVYLATEIHLDRKVAIKVLPPELTYGHGVERFKREAKTVAALDHPNIIPIYRISSGGSIFWYAMKFLEGESLDERLKRDGQMSLSDTLDILRPTADALDYAHEHGVVHRDIKPANIMIDRRGRVMVTDFGIAKALTEGTITASGSVVGTPQYMSPEQGMGKTVTGRADQYAVGIMAYRMLSGRVPFEADSAIAILQKHCMEPPTALERVQPGLPERVYRAVHKAIEKTPADRFSSVTAFVQSCSRQTKELQEYAYTPDMGAGLPPDISAQRTKIVGTPKTIPPIGGPARPRRRGLRVTGAVVGIATVAAAAVWWTSVRSTSDAPPPTPTTGMMAAPTQAPSAAREPLPPAPRTRFPGTMRFTSVPAGATIEVDGERIEGTSTSLPAGGHRVVIRADGYGPHEDSVSVRAGETTIVAFAGRRLPTAERPEREAEPREPAQTHTAPTTQAAPTRPRPTPAATEVAKATLVVGLRPPGDLYVDGTLVATSQSRWSGEVVVGRAIRLEYRRDGVVYRDTTITLSGGETMRLVLRGQ